MNAKISPIDSRTQRQRGVVLFVALIAMVVLSLAGVALIRSVDTTTSVAGNLSVRQASITPVNTSIEKAVDALFYSKTISNLEAVNATYHYYPSLQAAEKANGVPAALAGAYPPSGYAFAYDTDTAGFEMRWVIERVCTNPPPAGATIDNCDMLEPRSSKAKTTMKLKGPTAPPIPFYRVTVRVDQPATSTVTYAQAMLR